jgi:hypothetical protein
METPGAGAVPGGFPETPAANDVKEFSVNPIPATEGNGNPIKLAPGEKVPDPSTLTSNTVSSTVKDDESLAKEPEEQAFGIAPIPATGGTGNPISLKPGEKVPHPSEITSNTIDSNVTLDKESYEKGTPILPPVVTPQVERESKGTSAFDIPPITNTTIPESSLPMGGSAGSTEKDAGPFTQSSGPTSTTAALAAKVPLESTSGNSGVPEIVKESQEKAHFDPEASAIAEEVKEKSAVEKELLSKVPTEGATSEGRAGTSGVPEVVKESIVASHQGPEATTNSEAVAEKAEVEQELLKSVKTEEGSGTPAPGTSVATYEKAPASTPLKSAADSSFIDSANVSPKTQAATPAHPIVTTGVASTAIPTESGSKAPETPAKDTPVTGGESSTPASAVTADSESTTTTDKKKKRRSFFGLIKSKISHKDK